MDDIEHNSTSLIHCVGNSLYFENSEEIYARETLRSLFECARLFLFALLQRLFAQIMSSLQSI